MAPWLLHVCVLFQGDSGGPYMCRDRRGVFTQRGIASFALGDSTNKCAYFVVYMNVSAYYDWIHETMRNN